MPDLLAVPPPPPTKPKRGANLVPFTTETARAAALRRHQLDQLRNERASRLLDIALAPTRPNDRLALVVEQIALTRASLNAERLDGKDRAQLVRALCALLDQQRILLGEPLPGSRRPSVDGARARRPGREGSLLLEEVTPSAREISPVAPAVQVAPPSSTAPATVATSAPGPAAAAPPPPATSTAATFDLPPG
jgi:hypothetical protein